MVGLDLALSAGFVLPSRATHIQMPGEKWEKKQGTGHCHHHQIGAHIGCGPKEVAQLGSVLRGPFPPIAHPHEQFNGSAHVRQFISQTPFFAKISLHQRF